MKIYTHNLHKQRGVSLLEVLITLVIIAIGVVGLTATQGVSIKETGNAGQRTSAILMANELIERMHNNRLAIKDYKKAVDAGCGAASTKCITGYYNKNKVVAPMSGDSSTCSTKDVAANDVYDTICRLGNKEGINGKSSNSDYLLDAKVAMNCIAPPANAVAAASGVAPSGAAAASCGYYDTVELVITWQSTENALKENTAASASGSSSIKYFEDKVVVRSVL